MEKGQGGLKIITNDSIPLQQKAKGYQQRSPQTRNAWRGSTDEIRDSQTGSTWISSFESEGGRSFEMI
jgi:hypothetical protein